MGACYFAGIFTIVGWHRLFYYSYCQSLKLNNRLKMNMEILKARMEREDKSILNGLPTWL